MDNEALKAYQDLMTELSEIRDLNEVAQSYKLRTEVLSEKLEVFLKVAEKEAKDVAIIKNDFAEIQKKYDNLKIFNIIIIVLSVVSSTLTILFGLHLI